MQKRIFFQISLILLIAVHVTAQNIHKIQGQLQDSTSKPIPDVTVILIDTKDTSRTISNESGAFYFSGLSDRIFNLQIRALGFQYFNSNFIVNDDSVKTPIIITLRTSTINLKEVVVTEKIQPVIFKKDTVEYNTLAYKTHENDKVEDMLKQLPGVEVDEYGNVTSQGKSVTKLRVNGADFFTGNVKDFIRLLPANILDKIQIIDDYGDEASFSGIKKGESEKMLNLVTKPGMNQGIFGNLNLIAATNERYGIDVNQNIWRDAKQISVVADLNTQKNTTGVNNVNSAGLTYNNNLAKNLNITNSYTFSSLKNSSQNNSFTQTINNLGIIDNQINNTIENKSTTHQFSSNITFKPSESEYLKARINLSANSANSVNDILSQQTGIIRQDLKTHNTSSEHSPNANASLFWGKRLNKHGRVITAHIEFTDNNINNNQAINNDIKYHNDSSVFIQDSLINRQIINRNRTKSGNFILNYVEPIDSNSQINLNYSLDINQQQNEFITNLDLPSGLIQIDSLSQSFNSTLYSQNLGIDYHYVHSKIDFSSGVNVQKVTLTENYLNQKNNFKNSQTIFFPTLNLMYAVSSNNNYELKYSGNSTPLTFEQLQTVGNTTDFQNTIVGNPNLKPSFTHSLNSSYKHFGLKSNQFFLINAGGSFTQNQIVNSTRLIKDSLGLKQITSYVNANGTYSLNSGYEWSIPVRIENQSVKISLHGNINYTHEIVYTDSVESHNISKVYTQNIQANSFLQTLFLNLTVQYQKRINSFTTGYGLTSSTQNWSFIFNGNIAINKTLSFNLQGTKQLNSGYTNINVNDPLIINAALRLIILKRNPFNVQIQILDLFNQANRISQTISGSTITNNRSNYISRYFIFSLNIPFSKFNTANKSHTSN